MIAPIYILEDNREVELSSRNYSLKILGGWNVSTNGFSIVLKEVNGEAVIRPEKTIWRIQSFSFGKRAKKIATFKITKRAIYKVEIINPYDLKVKKSGLFSISYFQRYLPTNEIQICIE